MHDWRERASCQGAQDLDFVSEDPTMQARCLQVCAVCPVVLECRQYARTFPAQGVWGGQAFGGDPRRSPERRARNAELMRIRRARQKELREAS